MQISDLGNWIFYSSTKDFDKGYYYGEWLLFFSENSYDYIASKCMEEGLIHLTAKTKIRLLPPLNITFEELNKGLDILIHVLKEA